MRQRRLPMVHMLEESWLPGQVQLNRCSALCFFLIVSLKCAFVLEIYFHSSTLLEHNAPASQYGVHQESALTPIPSKTAMTSPGCVVMIDSNKAHDLDFDATCDQSL